MATTTITDIKVYDELMYGGFAEKLSQNLNGFNAASNGAMVLQSIFAEGDFSKEKFFQLVTGMTRRDDTSTADATASKVTMDENIAVKLKAKFGPFETTDDAFRSQGLSLDEFSFNMGQAMADDLTSYMLNRSINAANAAISGVAAMNHDAGAGLLTHVNLNQMLAKMGDRSANIIALVMSGAAFHALVGSAITDMKFNDSGVAVYNGGVPTLGRPVFVTDNDTLSAGGQYVVLGLQRGAVVVNQSEAPTQLIEKVGGKENIITRFQGEAAFNLSVKGFKWDTQNGGRNPNDAALVTATNWDKVVTSNKDIAGARLVVSQA